MKNPNIPQLTHTLSVISQLLSGEGFVKGPALMSPKDFSFYFVLRHNLINVQGSTASFNLIMISSWILEHGVSSFRF